MGRWNMGRRRRCRRFFAELPAYIGKVEFTPEELEALRLADVEGLTQIEAAERMGISQPTFHRILKEARRKAGIAITGGAEIDTVGEVSRIFKCRVCGNVWKEPFSTIPKMCPFCGEELKPENFELMEEFRGGIGRKGKGKGGRGGRAGRGKGKSRRRGRGRCFSEE